MDNVRKERRKNRHLNERFFMILEDFVHEYKIAKSHPDVIEYSNRLGNTESEYKTLQKDMFIQKNHLNQLVLEMNARIRKQTRDIDEYRKKVALLKMRAKHLKPIENSSEGLYKEEREIYTLYYYETLALIIGICMASGLTYATFRKT